MRSLCAPADWDLGNAAFRLTFPVIALYFITADPPPVRNVLVRVLLSIFLGATLIVYIAGFNTMSSHAPSIHAWLTGGGLRRRPDPGHGDPSFTNAIEAGAVLLRDGHRYGWEPELASTTVVFSEDFPRLQGTGPARALTEYVIAQIESNEALARLTHPTHQLMTRIMIRCGIRSGDCRQLTFDYLVHDGEGHPYLQYLNHKMKRIAFVPVDDDLAAHIRDQHAQC